MDAGTETVFYDRVFKAKLSNLVRQLEGDPDANSAVDELRQLFPDFIVENPTPLPVSPPPSLPAPAVTSTTAAATTVNALRRFLRAIFGVLGLIHEPTPQPPSEPGVP